MKVDHILTPYSKINSIWIKDVKVKSEATKILEDNTGSKFSDTDCSNIFLDMSPKQRKQKQK